MDREQERPATAPAPGPTGRRRPEVPLGPAGDGLPRADVTILRAFLRDDRLTAIPAQVKKRTVVLRYLLERCFPEDRVYPEKEVNQRLALFHADVAALRRGLVDGGLMTRAGGQYRRAWPPDPGDGSPQAS